MKVIYMATTLGWMHQINPKMAQEVVNKGEIKELEEGVKYIVTYENGDDNNT